MGFPSLLDICPHLLSVFVFWCPQLFGLSISSSIHTCSQWGAGLNQTILLWPEVKVFHCPWSKVCVASHWRLKSTLGCLLPVSFIPFRPIQYILAHWTSLFIVSIKLVLTLGLCSNCLDGSSWGLCIGGPLVLFTPSSVVSSWEVSLSFQGSPQALCFIFILAHCSHLIWPYFTYLYSVSPLLCKLCSHLVWNKCQMLIDNNNKC